MARGTTAAAKAAAQSAEDSNETTVTDAATQADASAPAAPVEKTDAEKAADEAAATTALEDWKASADALLAIPISAYEANLADPSQPEHNGVPDEELSTVVLEKFQSLPSVKVKNAAKNYLQEISKARMDLSDENPDFWTAKAAMVLRDTLSAKKASTKKASTPAAPVDPTEGFVNDLLAVRLAYDVLKAQVPEGTNPDWPSLFKEALAASQSAVTVEDALAAEDVSALPEAWQRALKLGKLRKSGGGKGSGTRTQTYSGPPRSVQDHIKEAFANLPSGAFLKVSEIAGFDSSAYRAADGSQDHPSSGAVTGQINSDSFAKRYPELTAVTTAPKGISKK